MKRSDVAVLYVDRRGPYPSLVTDWYDEQRDATSYAGTLPVVAHPPCGPYSRLRALNKYQKPEHAIHALGVVRRVGGVLEHPAQSTLWKVAGLPLPGQFVDDFGGYTIEVEQVRWGHVARKRTWLYIVGLARWDVPPIPGPREPTHWTDGAKRPAGMKLCSAELRRRTPPAFAAWLIEIASKCVPPGL